MPDKACLPEADFAAAVRCIDEVADLVARRGDWNFTLKCHPRYDHPELYQRMNRQLPAGRAVPIVLDRPVCEMARLSDAVVIPNARTSAILEASMEGRPVIILDTCMIWFDHGLWGTDAWPMVRSVAELERELEAAFAEPGRYQALADRTADARRASIGGTGPAAPRAADVIEDLAESELHARVTRPRPCNVASPRSYSALRG